jgi:hypothetical protein
MLSAVEGLFGLMFPYSRLTASEIELRLLPVAQGAYERDATAQRAARAMLTGFKQWVEASHTYRREAGVEDALPLG